MTQEHARVTARLELELAELDAMELAEASEAELDRELAEAGIDFPAFYDKVQATLADHAEAEPASTLVWELPSYQQVIDAIRTVLAPGPTLAYRGDAFTAEQRRGDSGQGPQAPLRAWPEQVPALPAGLSWVLRAIEAIPEAGLIIVALHALQDPPPARPPEVALYLGDDPAELDEYAYRPDIHQLEVRFVGDLPGRDFALRLEAPDPGRLVLRLSALQ